MRQQTDEIIPIYWVLIPIVAIVLGMFVAAAGVAYPDVMAWSWLVSVVSFVLIAILYYKLLTRKNEHSRRESMLRAAIIQDFRDRAAQDPDLAQQIGSQIGTMESIHYEANARETEMNPIVWVILLIVPIVNFFAILYIYYVLTLYAPEHDRRWHAFTQQTQYAGNAMGMQMVLPSWRTLPDRSFILYLILTLITIGLFGIYWIYVLIEDMNEHMQVQWQFEDQLLREMN